MSETKEPESAAAAPPPEAAAELAALRSEFDPGGADPQPEPPPEDAGPPTSELIKPIVVMLFRIGAPAWEVADAEHAALAEAYAAVLDKWFPGGVFGVELNALILTAAIVGPRLAMPTHPPEPEAEPEKKTKGEGAARTGWGPPPGAEPIWAHVPAEPPKDAPKARQE